MFLWISLQVLLLCYFGKLMYMAFITIQTNLTIFFFLNTSILEQMSLSSFGLKYLELKTYVVLYSCTIYNPFVTGTFVSNVVKRQEKRLEIMKTSNAVTPLVWDHIVSKNRSLSSFASHLCPFNFLGLLTFQPLQCAADTLFGRVGGTLSHIFIHYISHTYMHNILRFDDNSYFLRSILII